MFELAIVFGAGTIALIATKNVNLPTKTEEKKTKQRLERLWSVAQKAMNSRKFVPAEKALLTILKIDHKNAPAYNRLGILYARQHNYDDAVECFEIASSLEPKASSLHNLGLIFYEIEKYDKSINAFKRAIELEPMAARHIALAKVYQKQEKGKLVIEQLIKAAELEPNPQTYKILIDAYKAVGDDESVKIVEDKLKKLIVPKGRKNTVQRAKKVQ
ncbi:TPA: tetratricopeptide repeat protein [Candidatus Saccharibacteria bacterium]|nr:tetratricopeptide repeat protein [Candidatus Saccharibacteria bacterium]HIO87366.1 tetratricopeptide repeat protein [Candidatus Saccharibacteria bacterium]